MPDFGIFTGRGTAKTDPVFKNSFIALAERLFNPLFSETFSLAQIQQLSPAALAYLGDAVYELYIRNYYLLPPKRSQIYHSQVVAQVRAESQARHLRSLEPHLTPPEQEIVRRGRNATSGHPKRVAPEIYQQATGLETLMGYLYLTDPQRLTQLLEKLELDSTQE